MEIKVLGIGCVKCKALEKSVREAVTEMNIHANITKVQDIVEILDYGILSTPGLVIDEKVVSSGHILSKSQVKKIMEKYLLIFIILITGLGSFCYGQDNTQTDKSKALADQNIEVYYFHMSRRCATCLAVEAESEAALKKLYPTQMESGTLTFKSLNLEEEVNNPLAEKLQVSGQTLLIVKGDKKIDMTGDGFLYARTNPEKLQEKFKAAIDPLL